MSDPINRDPLTTDSPGNPGGVAGAVPADSGTAPSSGTDSSGTNSSGTDSGGTDSSPADPPGTEALDDVDDDTAAAHAADLDDADLGQGDDHPYDRDGDPDSGPKNAPDSVVGSAGTPVGGVTTDADQPWPNNSSGR